MSLYSIRFGVPSNGCTVGQSLATFLINRGRNVKTIQGLLHHAKATTMLDLYSQVIDASKLDAQEDITLAITSSRGQIAQNTGEELQVKF